MQNKQSWAFFRSPCHHLGYPLLPSPPQIIINLLGTILLLISWRTLSTERMHLLSLLSEVWVTEIIWMTQTCFRYACPFLTSVLRLQGALTRVCSYSEPPLVGSVLWLDVYFIHSYLNSYMKILQNHKTSNKQRFVYSMTWLFRLVQSRKV